MRSKNTYKCPTGFPAAEGVGHANQTIPLAAHFRSAFLSTVTKLLPSDGTFLQAQKQVSRCSRHMGPVN